MVLFAMFIAFGAVFVVCELLGRISAAFDGISDRMQQLDWYLLPIQLKFVLPTTIAFAQQSIDFPIYGSVSSNRDAFKTVLDCGCIPEGEII